MELRKRVEVADWISTINGRPWDAAWMFAQVLCKAFAQSDQRAVVPNLVTERSRYTVTDTSAGMLACCILLQEQDKKQAIANK
jgi:hypothetical protein